MKENTKTKKILDSTLFLLKSRGDYGVTMRQVANQADMSLSNVQYYFKSKDVLLKAVAERYFGDCLNELKCIKLEQHEGELRETLTELLGAFLQHGETLSDMCRIFREYWAISTRNQVINDFVLNYYRNMAQLLMDVLRPMAHSEEDAADAVSVLIPYIEGYSITAAAMPVDTARVTELLTTISLGLLRGPGQPN